MGRRHLELVVRRLVRPKRLMSIINNLGADGEMMASTHIVTDSIEVHLLWEVAEDTLGRAMEGVAEGLVDRRVTLFRGFRALPIRRGEATDPTGLAKEGGGSRSHLSRLWYL